MKDTPRSLKVSALITTLGIAFATATLVIALSVAAGFESSYKRSILDFNAHIIMLKDGGEIRDYQNVAFELEQFEGVKSALPFVYRESMAVSKGIVKGVVIKGLDIERLSKTSNLKLEEIGSNAPPRERPNAIMLGRALAEKLHIKDPSAINLLTGKNRFEKVEVGGTFESGLYDYDSQFAFMPMFEVQKLFDMADEATGVEIKLGDPGDAKVMADLLEEEFPYPYSFTTWESMNKPIFEAVRLEKIMFAIIVGTLVLVGMFNIIGTLVLRIIYKVKDISTMSALGMRRSFIRVLFTFHGVVLGSVGSLLGVFIGGFLTWLIGSFKIIHIEPEIYFLSSLPVKLEFPVVGIIVAATVAVSFVVSLIASTGITRLNLIEGLRT